MINMRPFFCNLRELLGIYKELKLNKRKKVSNITILIYYGFQVLICKNLQILNCIMQNYSFLFKKCREWKETVMQIIHFTIINVCIASPKMLCLLDSFFLLIILVKAY